MYIYIYVHIYIDTYIYVHVYTDDTEHGHPPMDPACVDPRPVETVGRTIHLWFRGWLESCGLKHQQTELVGGDLTILKYCKQNG